MITHVDDKRGRWKKTFPDMEKIFPCQMEKNLPLDILHGDMHKDFILLLIRARTRAREQLFLSSNGRLWYNKRGEGFYGWSWIS